MFSNHKRHKHVHPFQKTSPSNSSTARESEATHEGNNGYETRYFISSLSPDEVKPCDFQKVIRDHWQVETSLHFVKDRWWEEDRHYLELADLIRKINNLVKFALRGGDRDSNIEGTSQMKVTIFIDFTIGGKLGKLGLGGHGESSLNLPRVAAGG